MATKKSKTKKSKPQNTKPKNTVKKIVKKTTVKKSKPRKAAPGLHKVDLTLNFEPSLRLRMFQFDPLHHDVAVYSLH